jgi:hypothetical protein
MANYRVTVGAVDPSDGNDAHTTTIALAVADIVANWSYAGTDVASIELIDASEENESGITLGGINGTASSTTYLKIYAKDDVKHDGTYNTSKNRVRGSGATTSQHVFIVSDNYVHLKNLAIMQDGSAQSLECIRVGSGVTNTLIEKCVLYLNGSTDLNQDCIYKNLWSAGPTYVYDCVMRCEGIMSRAAIHSQMDGVGGSLTHTWHIEHCTIDNNGATGNGSGETGIHARVWTVGDTVNFNVYNTISMDSGADDYYSGSVTGTLNWAGNANVASDTTTSVFSSGTHFPSIPLRDSDASGDQVLVTSLTNDAENYKLVNGPTGTDIALDAAVSGGAVDTRRDDTVDIAGNARPSYGSGLRDIGAFQLISSETIEIEIPTGPLR